MIFNTDNYLKEMRQLLKRNDFSDKLYNYIIQKGTNTNKLASDMNVTHTTIKRYLYGYPPQKGYAIRLCVALHLTDKESYELLDTAGIIFSEHSNKDKIYTYIIDNIDFNKQNIKSINDLIYELIKKNESNFNTKRKIDKIELI